MHPLGGEPGHGPHAGHRLEAAKREAGFLPRLAAGGVVGRSAVGEAGDGFHQGGLARFRQHRRAELAHQKGGAAFRIVGQHGDGWPVLLQLARGGLAAGEAHPQHGIFCPALVHGAPVENFRAH